METHVTIAKCGQVLVCSLLMTLSGCGGGSQGPKLYTVSGDVQFDGKPVETGRILFRSKQADQKGFSGDVTNGKYQLKTEEGEMSVEITASRLIPGKMSNVNGKPEPVGEMYLPAKYNAKTTLEAEVLASGKNSFPFDLTSK
jgi:hypothetical protein